MSLFNLLFGFRGRIGRLAFWVGGLVPMLISIAIVFALLAMWRAGPEGPSPAAFALLFLGFLVGLWITVALQVKRWHDRDKSAVWLLMNCVPYVGSLWVLVECGFLAGTPGPNRYDLDPADRAALDAALRDEIVARVVRRDVAAGPGETPDAGPDARSPSDGGWSR
ncbi:DUF805 domain-containing protein, partial [Oharaeibacter diazotrophicus]